jgi:hypothetical protein
MFNPIPLRCVNARLHEARRPGGDAPVPPAAPQRNWRILGGLAALTSSAAMLASIPAWAQAVNLNFPASAASGYDQQLGVTVLSRQRSLYDAPGVQLDGFEIRPQLSQTFGYSSNPIGASTNQQGSALSHTSASVTAASTWSRDSLAATASTDHYSYFSLPGGDYTDWNVGLQGGYTIADSQLTAAYSHSDTHQLGAAIGTVRSDTPSNDSLDTTRLYYTFKFNRLEITPDFSFGAYRFGDASAGSVRLDQRFLDRNVFAGGVSARYSLNGVGGILVVARVVDSEFIHNTAGTPSNDSRQYQLLSGLDYQLAGLWRYQLLVGGEVDTFAAMQVATRVAPIVQGNVIWTPTGLTTVSASASRTFAEPLAQGNNGFFLNAGTLQVDYELKRNILLQGKGGFQYAQYLGGGTQASYNFGANANWLLNSRVRVSVDYNYYHQNAASDLASTTTLGGVETGALSQSIAGLTLHLAL